LINYCDIFIHISLSLLSAGRYYDALAQLTGIAISAPTRGPRCHGL
jgi:hypothetical protein